jgi:two-component system response regulator AtoC
MASATPKGDPLAMNVLVVDDDDAIRDMLCEAVRELGHDATAAADGEEALDLAGRRSFQVVLCDVRLPRLDGLTVFHRLHRDSPSTDVILMTGFGGTAEAVEVIKAGAFDYLTKPFGLEELRVRLSRLAQRRALRRALAEEPPELPNRRTPHDVLLGTSPQINRVRERLESIAQSDAPVLIVGESGTGKELVARRIHELSTRRERPFVAMNCAAFPETLLEAELFGHERGAFTGAVRRRDGRFKAADGGTLLLDEVAEIPASAQVKLLRVLEEGIIEPLGTNDRVPVDVRIISATHRNLKERIAGGTFRQDLYFRLNVLDVSLPRLRDRRGDLAVLVGHFLRALTPAESDPPALTPRAWASLANYSWPGNVRELKHAVEHAVVLARSRAADEIDLEDLPDDVVVRGTPARPAAEPVRRLADAVREFEREYLRRALDLTGGRKARAAELLGISRKSLWKKLRGYGLGPGGAPGARNARTEARTDTDADADPDSDAHSDGDTDADGTADADVTTAQDAKPGR